MCFRSLCLLSWQDINCQLNACVREYCLQHLLDLLPLQSIEAAADHGHADALHRILHRMRFHGIERFFEISIRRLAPILGLCNQVAVCCVSVLRVKQTQRRYTYYMNLSPSYSTATSPTCAFWRLSSLTPPNLFLNITAMPFDIAKHAETQ